MVFPKGVLGVSIPLVLNNNVVCVCRGVTGTVPHAQVQKSIEAALHRQGISTTPA